MAPRWCSFIAIAVLVLALTSSLTGQLGGQNVFQVTLHAVDANNAPVGWPVLFSISGFGNVTSYQNGTLTLNMPSGEFHVSASVFGVQVGESDLTVDKALDVVILSRVYSLKLTVSGLHANDSANGFAYAFFGVGGVANVSLSNGAAAFGQLPAGSVSVLVTRRDGTPLANGQLELGQNDELTVYLSKFFHVSAQVVDASRLPVAQASISLGLLTATTDANGTASMVVPSGSIPVQVTFHGIIVYTGSVQVAKDTGLLLTANVSRFQALIIDELGQPLANHDIAIRVSNWQTSVRTDADGYLVVTQMPYGTVVLRVLPDGVERSVDFPLPQDARSIQLFTGPLVMQADALSAVMFGSMKVKVTVKVGGMIVTNASVFVDGRPVSLGPGGILVIPVGFEWQPRATVTVKAYGATRSVIVSAPASPIALLTLPLALLPMVVWRLMVARYKRRRVSLVRV